MNREEQKQKLRAERVQREQEHMRGVHGTHCCPIHGCKYGDDDCPVESNTVQPQYPKNNGCEICESVRGDCSPVVPYIMDAQADLQTALGHYRLDHGRGMTHTEQQMISSLARLHALLDALGHPMYDPTTHPDVGPVTLR